MTHQEAVTILQALEESLAKGKKLPAGTGQLRKALVFAIEALETTDHEQLTRDEVESLPLKTKPKKNRAFTAQIAELLIPARLWGYVQLLDQVDLPVNPKTLCQVLLGSKDQKFRIASIELPFYRLLKYRTSSQRLLPYLQEFFSANAAEIETRFGQSALKAWENIAHFEGETFNRLTATERSNLSKEIDAIPLFKSDEHLPSHIREMRKTYPRAFEPWGSAELQLLENALEKSNDIDLLVSIFKRNSNSIKIQGQKILSRISNRGESS